MFLVGEGNTGKSQLKSLTDVIAPEKQDKALLDKLYAEKEGIVQKCIKALQTVIANGYRFSEQESVSRVRV